MGRIVNFRDLVSAAERAAMGRRVDVVAESGAEVAKRKPAEGGKRSR